MGREVSNTETDRGGNKVVHYTDDTKETHKTDFWGHEVIEVSRDGGFFWSDEKLAEVRPETSPFGVTTNHVTTSDGESYVSRDDPNKFIWSNYSTNRNGKTTNESYGEAIMNHRNELAQNLNISSKSNNLFSNDNSYYINIPQQRNNGIWDKTTNYSKSDMAYKKIIIRENYRLFDLIKDHPDLEKRKHIASGMMDQNILFSIILNHPDLEVREIALENLTDMKQLEYFAKCSLDPSIRQRALKKTSIVTKLKFKIQKIIISIIDNNK